MNPISKRVTHLGAIYRIRVPILGGKKFNLTWQELAHLKESEVLKTLNQRGECLESKVLIGSQIILPHLYSPEAPF